MGATNHTDTLGLPQFGDGDKPTWRGDVNGAFLDIEQGHRGVLDRLPHGNLDDAYEQLTGELFVPAWTLLSDTPGPSNAIISGVPVKSFQTTLRVFDGFNRANSATTLGSTDTGKVWVVTGTWGISSNAAYNPAAISGNRATIDVGVTDMEVSATVKALPGNGQAQLVARFVDASNYITATVIPTGAVLIIEVNAGVFTTRAVSAAGVAKAGSKLAIRVVGTVATLFVDGAETLVYSTVAVATGTGAGMRNGGDDTGAFRFDDFSVGLDPSASGLVSLPDSWTAFDVTLLYTNFVDAGDARYSYGERFLSFTGGVNLLPTTTITATATGVANRTLQETVLATNRPIGASRHLAFKITRLNADPLDTVTGPVGLVAVRFKESV